MAWNRPIERDQGSGIRDQGARKFPFRGLIAGVIVVVGAAVAAWWMWPDASTPVAEGGDGTVGGRIREVAPAAKRGKTPRQHEKRGGSGVATTRSRPEEPGVVSGKGEAVRPTVRKKPTEGSLPSVCDQVLAMISPESGGVDGPPLPNNAFSEKEFREALKSEIRIMPDDDRHTVALKESVIALRQQMLELLDSGETVDEILRRYQEDQAHFASIRRDIAVELKAIRDTGTEEDARHYRDMMNLCLQQINCPEVTTPITKEEYEEIEQKRIRELEEK